MRLKTDLPIENAIEKIRATLSKSDSLLISAEPGAGKTTIVPLVLLDEPWLAGQRIIMLEPRRIATRAAAKRMAFLLGEKPGETVGYRTRTETVVSKKTRIEVVTEAILTRMIQADPELKGIGLIIFDEFHERSIHADLGLALTLDARSAFRDDLKIILMSATLDSSRLSALLDDAPIISVSGKCFPVRVIHSGEMRDKTLEERTTQTVLNALKSFPGDILVFLPGESEIRRTASILSERIDESVSVLPLFGNLPVAEQDRAMTPAPDGKRRVILSTSIAESSITVDGVRIVIDCGLMRVPRFSPGTGMDTLETTPVSKASAEQRRGRAGRTSEGVCIRLWSETAHATLQEFTLPEIMESDFAPTMLELLKWGLNENSASSLKWPDFPTQAKISQAIGLLKKLAAVKKNGGISQHGEKMLLFPLHPRLAHMVLESQKLGLHEEASAIAAILSERDFCRNSSADIIEKLNIMKTGSGVADRQGLENVRRLSKQIHSLLHDTSVKKCADPAILPAFAYPDRIACRRESGGTEYLLANGTTASLRKEDHLNANEYLAVAQTGGTKERQYIFLASQLNQEDIKKYFGELLEEKSVVLWDAEKRCTVPYQLRSIGSLVLERKRSNKSGIAEKELLETFLEGIRKHGIQSLELSKDEENFRERVNFLHRYFPADYPDFSDDALMKTLNEWLTPFIYGFTRLDELKKLNIRTVLDSMLQRNALMRMNMLAPERLEVPSGSRIKVDYSNQEYPCMSVRLQEIFGMKETPRIADGRVAVMMDILSPAMRTVQRTSDLRHFWENSYYLVRKDMRGRYPKHDWPENPSEALPHRGVKKRNH